MKTFTFTLTALCAFTGLAKPLHASVKSDKSFENSSSSGYSSDVRPDGMPGFPLNDNHVSAAPLPADAVPDRAALYTPKGFLFDTEDFMNWTVAQSKSNPSKWLKVAPGTYEYMTGAPAPAGADPDPNLYVGRNIRFVFFPSGWTLDLRGVTFSIPITPKNIGLRPWDAIYVNQSPDFTILGGTIWFDQGEIYSYATITSLSSTAPGLSGDEQLATIKLDKGYNASAWATDLVNARDLACWDVSAWPTHVTDGQCNFWYMSDYSFDEGTATATAKFGMTRSLIKEGHVLVRNNGFNMNWAVGTETEGGLKVRGMTTNGGFIQIGTNDGGSTAVFDDCYVVNPPPRPDVGPRYGGPAMQWGNIFATYNAPGLPNISFPNSYLQKYGGSKDLVPLW